MCIPPPSRLLLMNTCRYTTAQVLSVVAVFIGVLLTTFSASSNSSPKPSASPKSQTSGSDSDPHSSSYAKGISLLTIALMLSGLLGNIQDRTFTKYASRSGSGPGPWKEAMFYLHALALPLFLPSLPTLRSQLSTVIFSDPSSYVIQVPTLLTTLVTNKTGAFRFMLPSAVVPLAFTLATSLPCSAGANVLSSSMTSTSVALVLATRKATSLLLSTLVFGSSNVRSPMMMGAGAALVFVGSVGWAGAGVQIKNREKKTKASEKAKAKQE
jgi:UDP-xylose/UDP-N-acetylglucosamine transporter B4